MTPSQGHPATNSVWKHEKSAIVPSTRLVYDTYMHRSMALGCLPSLDVFQSNPTASRALIDRWFDRLRDTPTLQLLGSGLRHAASAFSPRHEELTRFLFEHLGWNPDDFVGFRCETSYPLWGAEYAMTFVYPPGEEAPPVADGAPRSGP